MIRLLLALVAVAFLCGCAAAVPAVSSGAGLFSQPAIPVQAHTVTSVNLAEANFTVVKTNVVGNSKGFSLLGLIPIYSPKVTKAMERMYAQADLREGAPTTPAHLVVEHSTTFYLLFSIPEVTVRADILEFSPKAAPDNGSKPDVTGTP